MPNKAPTINGKAVTLDYWREMRARNQFRTTTVKRGRSSITVRHGPDIVLSKTAIFGLDDPNAPPAPKYGPVGPGAIVEPPPALPNPAPVMNKPAALGADNTLPNLGGEDDVKYGLSPAKR